MGCGFRSAWFSFKVIAFFVKASRLEGNRLPFGLSVGWSLAILNAEACPPSAGNEHQ
jgi:hypothetical protein